MRFKAVFFASDVFCPFRVQSVRFALKTARMAYFAA